LFVISALVLLLLSVKAVEGATKWYWSRGTTQQVLKRFFPERLLRHRIVNGNKLLAEVVFSAKCSGIDTPVFRQNDPNTPLYSRLVCRVTMGAFDPYRITRRPSYLVRVLGPTNLAHPDAPHNFTLQRLP
jgi:hypothetical protein